MSEIPLQFGIRAPGVGNWQRFLNSAGLRDSSGSMLKVDEDFGARTAEATKSFQSLWMLPTTGRVGSETRNIALQRGFIPFILAKNFNLVHPSKRTIDLIVIHTMEAPEKPTTARAVAEWFGGANAPQASAHYCLGDSETIQCVRDMDVAWHAPGANHNGIGLEHVGFARQTRAEWQDDFSTKMLYRSAALARGLTQLYGVPLVRLTPEGLKLKQRGFCGHVDVTNAFSNGRGHYDPGGAFPWQDYLQMVLEASVEP